MRIRKLGGTDAESLVAFYTSLSQAVTFMFQPFAEVNEAVMSDHLAKADTGKHLSFGIVADDGTIMGHGFILHIDSDKPVLGIGLHQSIHGRGWGHKLMGGVLREADDGKRPLVTLTVLKVNRRARALYEKMGFVLRGEATFRESNDSYYMERRPLIADRSTSASNS